MAISAKRRKALPRSAFAYPSTRSYPIDTPARARNALARAAQKGTKGSYATVARKVRAKYGNRIASVGRKRGTVSAPGYRKRAAPRPSVKRRTRASTRSIAGRKR
jgi:hypothetical protein